MYMSYLAVIYCFDKIVSFVQTKLNTLGGRLPSCHCTRRKRGGTAIIVIIEFPRERNAVICTPVKAAPAAAPPAVPAGSAAVQARR